jgi:hypothetical protein
MLDKNHDPIHRRVRRNELLVELILERHRDVLWQHALGVTSVNYDLGDLLARGQRPG